MEITTNAADRKALARTLADAFGTRAEYLGPPTFAYRIGDITIDREAKVIFEDSGLETAIRMALEPQPDEPEECQTEEAETQEAEEVPHTGVGFPIGEMKPQGIVNLLNMLHSKQYLINRAIGQEGFFISDSLIEDLTKRSFDELNDMIGFIEEHESGIKGIRITKDRIDFDGFPSTIEATAIKSYCELAVAMVKRAAGCKRISAEQTIEENEKYYMRVWLVSIGFEGNKGKEVRNFLLKNLKGHTAFRTEADRIKWQEARKAAKDGGKCLE